VIRPILSLLAAAVLPLTPAVADDSGDSVLDQETYLLRYQLKQGEQLHYEVTHVAKTKTRIRGSEQVSKAHTTSRRHWDVTGVSDAGEMIFDHVLDSVSMTQQQDDGNEIRWDSTSGETPPAAFKAVSEQIGTRVATLTINSRGQEKQRENHGGTKANLGMGSLTLALPDEPVAVGHSWSVPREIKTRGEAGEVKVIKIRELYTLEKVQTGVATITVRTEPLTPIREDSVQAQVVQQLSNGKIRFDVDNGRMLSKRLDWDETVVGFQGANSMMEYRARFTERLVDGVERTALKP